MRFGLSKLQLKKKLNLKKKTRKFVVVFLSCFLQVLKMKITNKNHPTNYST